MELVARPQLCPIMDNIMNETNTSIATSEQFQLAIRLESIFMPNTRARRDALYNNQERSRFVHYTSAEAALNIIKTKRVWMRNTTCMSDYREVQHGFDMLNAFFMDSSKKGKFVAAIDACSANVATEAMDLFNQWWKDIQFNTYVASISEHDDKEDQHGRLSMWRGFGGNTARVAVVFSIPWFSGASAALNLSFSPVSYLKQEEVHAEIEAVIDNIHTNRDFLCAIDRQALLAYTFNMLVTGVTCLKHEGFHEEREWRVIYAPMRRPSPLVERSTEMVGGVPQVIYKIPLDVGVSNDLAGLEFAHIFDRLIIGPSQYPWAMYEAFVDALTKAGVPDAPARVCTSGIPIRA